MSMPAALTKRRDGAEEAIFTIPFCYTYVTKNNFNNVESRIIIFHLAITADS